MEFLRGLKGGSEESEHYGGKGILQKEKTLAWQCTAVLSWQNLTEARPEKQGASGFVRSNSSLCLRTCSV